MAVRIRLKRLGRKHRPFFRICAMDSRTPRDGKVIEELGFYDPMVDDVNARAVLEGERINYWLGVGAKPTEKVAVLIQKYGAEGTHLDQQKAALAQIKAEQKKRREPVVAPPPKPKKKPKPEPEPAEEAPQAAEPAAEGEAPDAAAPAAEAAATAESGGETAAPESQAPAAEPSAEAPPAAEQEEKRDGE